MNASPYIVCASQHDRKKNIFLVEDEKTAVSNQSSTLQYTSAQRGALLGKIRQSKQEHTFIFVFSIRSIMTLASTIAELEASINKWLFQDNNFVPIEEIQRLQKKHNNGKKMNLQTRKRKTTSRVAKKKKKKRKRRGSLKKKDILLKYYFNVSHNPSLKEKHVLSEKTGNTVKQVTDWFGNARRRLFNSTQCA